MESITKYELVTTLEFQLATESSLPDWIVRLDLYKTKKIRKFFIIHEFLVGNSI